MAASAFKIFDSAKEYLGDGTLDLDTNVFKIALFQSGASMSEGVTSTLTGLQAAVSEVANGNNYATGGRSLTGVTWNSVAAGVMAFDASDKIFTASGGAVNGIRHAVVYQSGGVLLCYAPLTTAEFNLADGSTLTIQFASSGLFRLS